MIYLISSISLLLVIGFLIWAIKSRKKVSPFGDISKYTRSQVPIALTVTDRQGQVHTIEQAPNDHSLLETLQKAPDIKARSSCKNAHCGACIAELHHGTVSYFQEGSFPLEGNEILPCSCTASSTAHFTLLAKVPRRKKAQ